MCFETDKAVRACTCQCKLLCVCGLDTSFAARAAEGKCVLEVRSVSICGVKSEQRCSCNSFFDFAATMPKFPDESLVVSQNHKHNPTQHTMFKACGYRDISDTDAANFTDKVNT